MQAALKRHLDEVTDAIELACREQKGHSIEEMATALMTAFFDAKMKDAKASVGVSRRLLESTAPEKHFHTSRRELIFLARTYLKACSARAYVAAP